MQSGRQFVVYDPNMGWIAETAAFVISNFETLKKGLFNYSEGKEQYKALRPQLDDVAKAYGTNIRAGAAATGLNPDLVATALSHYLSERNVKLTPAQLLATAPQTSPDLPGSSLPLYIGLGALAIYMLRR